MRLFANVRIDSCRAELLKKHSRRAFGERVRARCCVAVFVWSNSERWKEAEGIGTAKSPAHKAHTRVPTGTYWLDAWDACFDVAKEIVGRPSPERSSATLRHPSTRLHPFMYSASQACIVWVITMAEQNLNRGIELHSKAQALSVAFPLGGRGAATAFPPSTSSVFTNSPCYSTVLVFSCSPFCAGSANNKTTPERGTAAWRAFRPFLSFSSSHFLCLSICLSLFRSFSLTTFPATPCLVPGCSTSSAAIRGRSCRFLKCKYQSRNKRQRLAVQDESIVSAWARIYVDVFRIAMLAPCSLVREINVRIVVNRSQRYLRRGSYLIDCIGKLCTANIYWNLRGNMDNKYVMKFHKFLKIG